MSYAEDLFEESLKIVLLDSEIYFRNYRPDWLKNTTGHNLEYDFYIPRVKVAFEIQGQHHYTDDEQQKRDSVKKEISIKNGVGLFELSIFQVDPTTIRRKILSYSYSKGFRINFKSYSEEDRLRMECKIKSYKLNSISTYGNNECQRTPRSIQSKKMRNEVYDFLKLNHTFNINYKGVLVRARYVKTTKRSVFMELSNPYKLRAVSYREFYNNVKV